MNSNISNPDMNRGTNAPGGKGGTAQPRFGNFRAGNLSFPKNLARSQANTPVSQITVSYMYQIVPPPNDLGKFYSTGQFYFMLDDDKLLKKVYTFEMTRANMFNGHTTRYNNKKKKVVDNTSLYMQPEKDSISAFETFEGIRDNVTFIGIGLDASKDAEVSDNQFKYAADVMPISVVANGYCICPNMWEKNLPAGTKLYMIIKPIKHHMDVFVSATGERHETSSSRDRDTELYTDFVFYATESNDPPPIGGLSELMRGKYEQPPLESRNWIKWEKKGVNAVGVLQEAIVYSVGKLVQRAEYNDGGGSKKQPAAKLLSWMPDCRSRGFVEISLDIRRIY